ILPHLRSIYGDNRALEEERRLCYVGITRAREELVMTYAARRTLFGSIQLNRPSRFLTEIPEELFGGAPLRPGAQSAVRRAPPDPTAPRTSHFAPRTASAASEGSSLRSLDVQGLVDELRARKGGRFKPGDRVRHPTFGT